MELMEKDLVMTSREVAEITGKRHDHVMRDIREELESLESEGLEGQLIFGESSYKNSQNKEQTMFIMGREGAMQIATRYSAAIRRKLIMRLEELENKVKLPATYKEALLALVAAEEEKEQLALAVTNLKVAVADTAEKVLLADSLHLDTSVKIGHLAKTLSIKGLGQNNFFKWLRSEKILLLNNEPTSTYQQHFTLVNHKVDKLGVNKPTTMFKLESLQWLLNRLKRSGYLVNKNYDELIELLKK